MGLEGQPHVGLIAGHGQLPMLVARGMKDAGARVCCVGFRGHFESDLPDICDEFAAAGMVRPGRWIRLLHRWNVREAVMVGGVRKSVMHDPLRLVRMIPDWRAVKLWYRRLRADHRNAAVLRAVADELASSGITLIDSTTYIPDHLASPGLMGRAAATAEQQADIEFGWPLLERIVELDVGQAIAVRERDTIAVEAVEGTAGMIERAGTLCRKKGWVMLKTAKTSHDMRADVPTIGVDTIEQLATAGAGAVAIGAGRVILIDKPAVIAAANKAAIALVGIGNAAASS